MKIKIKNKIYEVKISEAQEGTVKISVNNRGFIFKKKNGTGTKSSCKAPDINGKAQKEVRAPIAGTISKIFARENEDIECGQKILSLSAMKMENEIVSESAGKIKKINVKEGQLVKANELLAEIE
jgi:biotin carboxyl carrier protein